EGDLRTESRHGVVGEHDVPRIPCERDLETRTVVDALVAELVPSGLKLTSEELGVVRRVLDEERPEGRPDAHLALGGGGVSLRTRRTSCGSAGVGPNRYSSASAPSRLTTISLLRLFWRNARSVRASSSGLSSTRRIVPVRRPIGPPTAFRSWDRDRFYGVK